MGRYNLSMKHLTEKPEGYKEQESKKTSRFNRKNKKEFSKNKKSNVKKDNY